MLAIKQLKNVKIRKIVHIHSSTGYRHKKSKTHFHQQLNLSLLSTHLLFTCLNTDKNKICINKQNTCIFTEKNQNKFIVSLTGVENSRG